MACITNWLVIKSQLTVQPFEKCLILRRQEEYMCHSSQPFCTHHGLGNQSSRLIAWAAC